MAGIAATTASMGAPLVALKLSSNLLYLAATGMMLIMNKIQPSQLAEEQRNAARLFKQLHGQIQTTIKIGTPTMADMTEFMDKVLALDKAYPLLLLGLAAVGSIFVGSPSHGSWATVLGCVAGALASVVNTFEHGGQVGMVFEMYRSNAGFFSLMEESIQSNLKERDFERRDNGELFEMKVALHLGRSLSQLKDLTDASSINGEATEEFASKLF
ncbi:hypothetical protein F0562_014360 [Nyssa sinensis]|uniref:F-box protein n=1 Tax=Nyssa sinensis TaxID=561372 RepID=A0A5J4ZQF0_9ASTE|nr:hypothetical protein F0562_014360 [Nyssa sinensis]